MSTAKSKCWISSNLTSYSRLLFIPVAIFLINSFPKCILQSHFYYTQFPMYAGLSKSWNIDSWLLLAQCYCSCTKAPQWENSIYAKMLIAVTTTAWDGPQAQGTSTLDHRLMLYSRLQKWPAMETKQGHLIGTATRTLPSRLHKQRGTKCSLQQCLYLHYYFPKILYAT